MEQQRIPEIMTNLIIDLPWTAVFKILLCSVLTAG